MQAIRTLWRTRLAAIAAVSSIAQVALAQPELPLSTLSSGGGDISSSSTGARVTVGQTVIGGAASGLTRAELGFWRPWFGLIPVDLQISWPSLVDRLYPSVPNPFGPTATLRFSLARDSKVRIELYDLQGRRVASMLAGNRSAGEHFFDFRTDGLASGAYLLRMRAGGFEASQRLVLLK